MWKPLPLLPPPSYGSALWPRTGQSAQVARRAGGGEPQSRRSPIADQWRFRKSPGGPSPGPPRRTGHLHRAAEEVMRSSTRLGVEGVAGVADGADEVGVLVAVQRDAQ